ncbi:MAG: hypothetical protein KJ757_00640 [Planctomycetes bacterium]|nr:hypothetical protein [Planctomycetota bacterium]MBU1517484.1 hypothetical protein [Planctomycetota bacterium]MBU2458592.1 hypothetical protein [Planctomycetota bacterium]MBU2596062.1 hypothetical protein [Planctomycetota bacterium]
MKPSVIVTVIFLLIVSAAHLIRLILQWKVSVNTFDVPLWMSAAACIVTAVLAFWLRRENKK